ncbi:hypothetical protein T01_9955 [Trichinella spiralis]|uniref:Uncharacterized protein n=1 Tax=Trichinella spiralis TaxID=6334 RepID=A0A0V1BBJ6_TRISP|nr:hypothetical protein T01_9955 [Trichinella spiralis]
MALMLTLRVSSQIPRQTNAYVSNKWLLKLPCAYLNTQGSIPSETPLIPIDDRKFFDIIMRHSLKMPSLVQYFVVFGKSIFLHFRSISNKLIKVVSKWVEMFWKVLRQTNAYVSNKWPLKLPCAYLNTQGSSPSETPLKRIDDRKFLDIIMRYSLKMPSLVQCFVGFGLLGVKFSPPFLTGLSTRYLIGPSIRRFIVFPYIGY